MINIYPFDYFFSLLQNIIGIYYTAITTEIYIQVCNIIRMDTILTSVLFSDFQYQLVLAWIIIIFSYLTTSPPVWKTDHV